MLKRLEIAGFKSFARKTVLDFSVQTTAIVGPNGSGKSNVAEAFRFALGEQSMKSMRGKRSEDLIFAGSHTAPRANRAAVAIVFDNTRRIFPRLDFDEVTIERAVFRDGSSEYSINGSKARLRDIQELLATANIGETGHHIISQGEADRILLAAPRERRAMLEDALGLKVYEFKKQEAERKLEKTEENVKQVESLRREIAPHIKFLSKQVERLERADELRRQLQEAYQFYFSIEEGFLQQARTRTEQELHTATEKLRAAEEELAAYEAKTTHDTEGLERAQAVREAEREVDRITSERGALARDLGRVEGALESAKRRSLQIARESDVTIKIPREDITALKEEVERQGAFVESSDPNAFRAALQALHRTVMVFMERFTFTPDDYLAEEESQVFTLEAEQKTLLERDQQLSATLESARNKLNAAREAVTAYEEAGREQHHRMLVLTESKAHEEGVVARLKAHLTEIGLHKDAFERERGIALSLVGSAALSYSIVESSEVTRQEQEDRLRAIERLKIRVEEAGGAGEDVRAEYKDAVEREAFLGKELEDLAKSAAGLRALIKDLDDELSKTFATGLHKVNSSFSEFFALMFGGGRAELVLEDLTAAEDDEDDVDAPKQPKGKAGIEVAVNLPKKRVQSLMQLSGGERALTSIALIFAMSQVNPPPFLILDETDAALDEANSRRYGDMIENLARRSQLIVISHNRETMSRAGILYGVTMGADGISKLLSVKFEDAAAVAK